MPKKIYLLLFCFLLLITNRSFSQVVTVTLPQAPDGQFFINDLNNIILINTKSSPLSGYLLITISDGNQVTIFTLQTPVTQIQPGFNNLASSKILLSGTMTYAGTSYALQLKTTGQLLPWQYVFCCTFYSTSGQILGVNCQEREVKTLFPPRLTYPSDGMQIPDLYPALSWTAPGILTNPNVTYHLRLVQIQSGQSPELAYSINNPLIDGNYINANVLQYPVNAQPLVYGQTYVWQVSATEQGYNLGVTQLWTFTPTEKKDTIKSPVPDSISYPIVTKQVKGDFYLAKGILRFAYTNKTNEHVLSYKIYDAKSRDTIKYNAIVHLQYGLNRIRIPLGESNLFKDGEFYLLDLEDTNRVHYYLSFIYKSQEITN